MKNNLSKRLKHLSLALLAFAAFAIAGCGGGGGSSTPSAGPTNPPPTTPVTCAPGTVLDPATNTCIAVPINPGTPNPPLSQVTAAAYTGTWGGNYTLTGQAGSLPLSIKLTGTANTNTVSGNIYSQKITGAASGTMSNDGTVNLNINNIIDGGVWGMKLSVSSSGISVQAITSPNSGASPVGSGSCAAIAPSADFDITGVYPVRYREIFPGTGTPHNATAIFIRMPTTGDYIGVLYGDGGMNAAFSFYKQNGFWWFDVPKNTTGAEYPTMGTTVLADLKKEAFTSANIISIGAMSAAVNNVVVDPSLAPLVFSMFGSYGATNLPVVYSFSIYLEGNP